ncbi:MAG: MBL fold metallo-hydrolase [Clostridiales bacterium]|nr:MBL fold metallo-hydrolase [Clostridiales bacterium]
MPAAVCPIRPQAFAPCDDTTVRWLGSAGAFINSRGTTLMIDPLLEGYDMPVLFESPILPADVPSLDALLITHIDNDHFSRATCRDLRGVCKAWHATGYVAEEMRAEGLPATGHAIGERFRVGDLCVTLTPADHDWQNDFEAYSFRHWAKEDCCGFWIETADGTIWAPGDSRLMEEQLHMPEPDVILFDFSDNAYHITLDGAVRLANAYPRAALIPIHWGTVDAPDMDTFNGDPDVLRARVTDPGRVHALCPGEAFKLGGLAI